MGHNTTAEAKRDTQHEAGLIWLSERTNDLEGSGEEHDDDAVGHQHTDESNRSFSCTYNIYPCLCIDVFPYSPGFTFIKPKTL